MNNCFVHRKVTARKQHRCECSRESRCNDGEMKFRQCYISKGERYMVESGIWDCEPYRNKLCLFHYAVAQAIYKLAQHNEFAYEGIDFDERWDSYIECYDSASWRKWLNAIRKEYMKVKERTK